MKSVLRSPVLQKVIIEADEDGSPDPKVKLGFDLSKLITSSSSGKKSSKSRNTRANTARSYSKADRSPNAHNSNLFQIGNTFGLFVFI